MHKYWYVLATIALAAVHGGAAHADLVFTFSDDGTDTTVNISGSFDTTGLGSPTPSTFSNNPFIIADPSSRQAYFDDAVNAPAAEFNLYFTAGVFSGDSFTVSENGVNVAAGDPLDGLLFNIRTTAVGLPASYGGEVLNITGTVLGQTLSDMGFPSTFTSTYSYAAAANGAGDSITWTSRAIPEASAALVWSVLTVGVVSCRRRFRFQHS